MNIRIETSIKGIDQKAWFPLAYLIYSYLQNHKNAGEVSIGKYAITFSKAIFFTSGKIAYEPYGIECRNGIVCYDGCGNFDYPRNNTLFIFLVNAFRQLKPGYYLKYNGPL
jgi:hypothetical protein